MGEVLILDPEGTVNELINPSAELDLANYNAVTSTISRSLERARFGRSSVKIVTSGVFAAEGIRYDHSTGAANEANTFSAYVRGASGEVRLRMVDTGNSLEWRSDPIHLRDDYWQRIQVTGFLGPAGAGTIELFIETPDDPQAITFYADGLQLEKKAYSTTYCDGDQEWDLALHKGDPFFEWEGAFHASTSSRSGRYRHGGRFRSLSQGLDEELWYTEASGLGMPPIRVNLQQFIDQEKASLQRQFPMPRALLMTFWASKPPFNKAKEKRDGTANLNPLHRARENLERVIKPDLVQEAQSALLRYENGNAPMDLPAIYESGLAWEGDLRFPFNDTIGLRWLAPDPFWSVDSQDVCDLDDQDQISIEGLAARIDGAWIGFSTDGAKVLAIEVHPQTGEIWVGGDFLEMEGDTDCARICVFSPDGSSVRGVGGGPGVDDGEVRAITHLADGSTVIGGSFDEIDGVDMNNIAIYDPATDTFSTMGGDPGLDAAVNALGAALNGDVYVGGEFLDTFFATTTLNRFAIWEAGTDTFAAVGGGPGLDGIVDAIEMDFDGIVAFLAGAFTAEFGGAPLSLKRAAEFNGFSTYSQMGLDGAEDRVRALGRAPNADIYAGGDFTNIGFNDVEKVAVFNRDDFLPLGQATDGLPGGDVYSVDVSRKGIVLYGGAFDDATGIKFGFLKNLATWDGTRFGFLDINWPNGFIVHAVAWNKEDIWIGGDVDDFAEVSSIQTCFNNGKARNNPILEVLGPADLLWLENQSTGQLVRMEFEIKAGETLRLDLRRGQNRAISDWRGNILSGLLPDSDVLDLLPGDNRIAFFARFEDDSEFSLRWQDRHWSFDD